MYLSIIIPAYNEEKRLPKTLFEIDKYLRQQNYPSTGSGQAPSTGSGQAPSTGSGQAPSTGSGQAPYEIVVVSDGSKDKTSEVVRGLMPQIKNLRLIDNKENHGKGYVTRQGLLEAKGDYRLFTDADNATSIEQVEKLLPEFKNGFDVVIGSRDVKGAVIASPQPFLRRMLGEIFNLMVQAVVGLWGIWDTQCGFKALSAKACRDILPKCTIDRWAFDPEILIIAKKKGYKIKEVPIVWVNDPESKVKMKSTIKMGLDLFKIRWNSITGKYK